MNNEIALLKLSDDDDDDDCKDISSPDIVRVVMGRAHDADAAAEPSVVHRATEPPLVRFWVKYLPPKHYIIASSDCLMKKKVSRY